MLIVLLYNCFFSSSFNSFIGTLGSGLYCDSETGYVEYVDTCVTKAGGTNAACENVVDPDSERCAAATTSGNSGISANDCVFTVELNTVIIGTCSGGDSCVKTERDHSENMDEDKANDVACSCGNSACNKVNGRYCTVDTSTCDCGKGRYRNTLSSFCEDCSAGSFTDQFSQKSCIACPAGYYADEVSSSSCKKCEPGFFNGDKGVNSDNHKECTLCPTNQISLSKGAFFCESCIIGKFYKQGIDGEQNSCNNCPSGWMGEILADDNSAQSTTCVKCLKGNYQIHPGKPFCLPCVRV